MQTTQNVTTIEEIITGLASDLKSLRDGSISQSQARISAELAKQYMAGVRMMLKAQRSLEDASVPVGRSALPSRDSAAPPPPPQNHPTQPERTEA